MFYSSMHNFNKKGPTFSGMSCIQSNKRFSLKWTKFLWFKGHTPFTPVLHYHSEIKKRILRLIIKWLLRSKHDVVCRSMISNFIYTDVTDTTQLLSWWTHKTTNFMCSLCLGTESNKFSVDMETRAVRNVKQHPFIGFQN
jgi:hypothetical protein